MGIQVSLSELQTFVGYLGGVQKFFEQRRKRVTQSRKDVPQIWRIWDSEKKKSGAGFFGVYFN